MVNNIDTILPLLTFEEKGDFVTILVLKRKKDQTCDTNNHQSVRTIKSYTIYSKEQLLERFDEIKNLCELFKARAYININAKSDKSIAMKMIARIAERVESGNNDCKHVYDSVIGDIKPKQKRWIIDIDKEDLNKTDSIIYFIETLEPIGKQKVVAKIPTLNGLHLITHPFRMDLFTKEFPKIDVQKDNPTCLYIPISLTNFVEEESKIDIETLFDFKFKINWKLLWKKVKLILCDMRTIC